MELRRPLNLLYSLGALVCAVGFLGFGFGDTTTSETICGVGGCLIVGSAVIELGIRAVASRAGRATR